VLDLCLSLALLGGLMAYFHWPRTRNVFLLPLFVFGTFLAASGIGFTLSSMNVLFRDVKHLVPFLVQMGCLFRR
jgi:homopolymeric O-antigen transport system permease protein